VAGLFLLPIYPTVLPTYHLTVPLFLCHLSTLPRCPTSQGEDLSHLVMGTGVVLLQREVPEHVNMAVAQAAAAAGVPVIQVGPEQTHLAGL
jgi:hypothetical protein